MSNAIPEPWASQKIALYILGAGFSAAAGLPMAEELWKEVFQRAIRMTGRAAQFRKDLNDYIEFIERTDGRQVQPDEVNFEEFLGYLDVEHYLGLRGSDTWSEEGNETQLIVKTLIGQILTERTPPLEKIPPLYLRFAEKLQPWDRVITFNYDVLLERACERVGKPYRLAPMRYTSVSDGSGTVDESSFEEVAILKMHGSLDWFDRKSFRLREEMAKRYGHPESVLDDPIFKSPRNLQTQPLVAGARFEDDPVREVHRVLDIERFYSNPAYFLATPYLIAPSTTKVVYARLLENYWRGMGRDGGHSFRMVIIGYSLPRHDEYAKQVIYRLVTNYQDIPAERVDSRRQKEPLIMVDCRRTSPQLDEYRAAYRFVDRSNVRAFMDGFNEDVVAVLC